MRRSGPASAEVRLEGGNDEALVEIFTDSDYSAPTLGSPNLAIDGFGYRWFRIDTPVT